MRNLIVRIRTVLDLGLLNVARVLLYRIGLHFGLSKVCRLRAPVLQGPFFEDCSSGGRVSSGSLSDWLHEFRLFGCLPVPLGETPPDWLSNPFEKDCTWVADAPWWKISDCDRSVGDIKAIWELSRFEWVLAFSQLAGEGDASALNKLNAWITDWCEKNPPYFGPNWKCGQEASIRVMHLAISALILDQVQSPAQDLKSLVHLHLNRIAPTLQYAIAQDNNHGTSESAALFIGGSWLVEAGLEEGAEFMQTGRKWLENRVLRLVGPDGTFSQYSLNYHRVLVDTLCMVEVWRRKFGLPSFSERFQDLALSACQWLRHMINPVDGNGPNVGANDGARLLQVTNANYRDFRPSVQLGMALFACERAYGESGSWDDALKLLNIPLPDKKAQVVGNYLADDGGFAILRKGSAMAMVRYPRFEFRPSHADVLHLDFWLNGQNILRDSGTYSYNNESHWLNYFSGTESHNTIQFDDRDQMPRLSRFLFGDWLRTSSLEKIREKDGKTSFGAGYVCRRGISHYRRISLSSSSLLVDDEIKGFKGKAELRWRLAPGKWEIVQEDGGIKTRSLDFPEFSLSVNASAPWVRCELRKGWESLHYFEKMSLPVLEIETRSACSLITEVRWSN